MVAALQKVTKNVSYFIPQIFTHFSCFAETKTPSQTDRDWPRGPANKIQMIIMTIVRDNCCKAPETPTQAA